jgi:phospholipase C
LRDDAAWSGPLANQSGGTVYPIHLLDPSVQEIPDPAHDHNSIQVQIAAPPVGGAPNRMGGFVQSYVRFSDKPPTDPSLVMGYYDQRAVPVFDLFARNFAICDHWFSALPTGTQANRLMAMSGESALVDDARVLLPDQPLVYDWLAQRQVPWCAYAKTFPFFSMMPRWSGEIATSLALSAAGGRGRFRLYEKFSDEWQAAASMPQVIFIEPEYTNGPHLDADDDHPPTGIAKGQGFLAEVYAVLTSNPARWANTMLIVAYDEHGGFFDHVPPLDIPATAGGFSFATTGVRVPAFVVSPHVAPGTVFSQPLDHTSILQLLADRFAGGQDYSAAVAARQSHLARLAGVLADTPAPRQPAPDAAALAKVAEVADALPPPTPRGADLGDPPSSQAFRNAVMKIAGEHPELVKSPGWKRLADAIAQLA